MKKLLIFLLLLSIPISAWGATITRYVNPGSSGGNGTTSALTGANAAYASLSAWETAEDCDLTDNGGDIMVVYCAGTVADTTPVGIAGWTTDPSHYIDIIGDYAVTAGVHYSTSYYRIEVADATAITITTATDVHISNIQILVPNVATTRGIYCTTTGNANFTLNRCVIATSSPNQDSMAGIQFGLSLTGGTSYVTNCVIYGFSSTNGWAVYLRGVSTVYAYNNTIYGNTKGITVNNASSTIVSTNNVSFNNTDDFSQVAGTLTIDYCASDDADGTNHVHLNSNASGEWTAAFPNYATFDFHLTSGGVCTNAGTDLFATVPSDIDGNTLTVRNDIGADEYVAVATAIPASQVIFIE